MNNPESNNSKSNIPESNNTEAEDPEKDEMKSSTNTSLLMPVALLLVLLLIPFSINSFIHFLSSTNQFVHPVIMKIPIDSSAVTAPVEAKQYEGFEVKLNVNTQQLSEFINEIVSIASVGTSIQGITGFISPNMQAEITGEGFRIENPGPQQQMYILGNTTEWKWHVVPKSSGTQTIKFKMHVTSTELDHQKVNVIELAQANVSVDSNPMMWMVYNWWISALLALALFGGWKVLRRYNDN
ncbi:MAG TPA: hypothetical protein PKM20_01170 [Nitrosomonas sp.]|uniref:hypothetical protein n=1 Tax=Nitrosomonas sp. TaxID=42353 RepID=UPI000E988486|nr:hypothetical protein [Nitrosomonas sp.]GJL76173.1 MAG: hypothetical protein NMNS02_22790 [Nitrosomonas sp.]HBV21176.1 hypothetical protein [Nitrosomonas sp.]HNP25326.1 hypothetical protein [Nitrosomonas sp.]